MAKVQLPLEFNYPLSHKKIDRVLGKLQLITTYTGDLQIEGVACMRFYSDEPNLPVYTVDIDFIKWQGADIKPVLEVMDAVILSDIEEAAIKRAAAIFSTLNNREEVA